MQTANRLSKVNDIQKPYDNPRVIYCPICKNSDFENDFVNEELHFQYCRACRLKFLNPQPSDQILQSIYDANYFLNSSTPEGNRNLSEIKQATARIYLDMIKHYSGYTTGSLLEIGSGTGDFIVEAQARGFDVTGVEYSSHAVDTARMRLGDGTGQVICGEVEGVDLPAASFDICVLSDVLEHARDPEKLLTAVHHFLKPGAVLFVATPSLDSWSARLMGKHWMEFKLEHLFYFSKATLENLLFIANFNRVFVRPNVKVLTPGYIFAHFDRFEVPLLTPVMRLAARVLPRFLLDRQQKLVASGQVFLARAKEATPTHKLSVIMPVFNECNTVHQAIERLIQKEIEGLEIEAIIVESNSTDGTRDAVLRFQSHPRVRVVLEESAKGKGHAVRTGLDYATGDFILIQDADLEYDIDDYDELLLPLRKGMTAFVLGSRHDATGSLKMRHFVDQPILGLLLNLGHVFFTTLLNLLFGQRTKDPFTMYKVFRRDCLFGLDFECNRFDFDFELVIKLWRKGYRALEIPVSYCSRSFHEGKKVSVFSDPLTWIKALIRYRFQPLNLAENVRRANLIEKAKGAAGGVI